MQITAHIINHTHWDREWFLTAEYTSQWIGTLIDKLMEITGKNPNFRFVYDGQTLFIDDLLALAGDYESKIKQLVQQGNLIVGPYYCQPDWKLTDGETLIRNLQYGQQLVKRFGGENNVGWMVDIFGHVSQSPQIHQLFGIDSVFVWRGVPALEPYFIWEAPDGSAVFAVDLFGGYRNLYGITHTPDLAIKRLTTELERLTPLYPTEDIPLFDGYDLEDNPEDPVAFYLQRGDIPKEICIMEKNAREFVDAVRPKLKDIPQIHGEMLSGKFGATFPGTISNRVYLKVLAHDCVQAVYHQAEPLAVLAYLKGKPYQTQRYEQWSKVLLQNAVHDCICGVSIDQVHEKMEVSYQRTIEEAQADVEDSLSYILHNFSSGTYSISSNLQPIKTWQAVDHELVEIETDGIGVFPIPQKYPIHQLKEVIQSFEWCNHHYQIHLQEDGTLVHGGAKLGYLFVSKEGGDTYSDEIGEPIGVLRPHDGLKLIEKSDVHAVVQYESVLVYDEINLTAQVQLTFDPSPRIGLTVILDSIGTDFYVELVLETSTVTDFVKAGMPFDTVTRPLVDRDLFELALPDELSPILMGQRELNEIRTYPFHHHLSMGQYTIFAKGIYAYRAFENGDLRIGLRRSVETLTKTNLKNRVGDAGPFFYVPDARCERCVEHHFAVTVSDINLNHELIAFTNPPLIATGQDDEGTQTVWRWWGEDALLSSMMIQDNQVIVRYLSRNKKIVNHALPIEMNLAPNTTPIRWCNKPSSRVGSNHGLPEQSKIDELIHKSESLQTLLEVYKTDDENYQMRHSHYAYAREMLEYQLSAVLNRIKLAQNNELTDTYLYGVHPEIADLGWQLNQLRIKRRIFDYVIKVL